MYILTLYSNYCEYSIDETQEFENLNKCVQHALSRLEEIRDGTSNERQKKFASVFIEEIKSGKKSLGYNIGNLKFAVDIVSDKEIKDMQKRKEEELKREIKEEEKRIQALKRKRKKLSS